MKKDELLGMEVYYEENPKIYHGPIGPRGHTGVTGPEGVPAPKGVWVFGDSDEEDDFWNDYGEDEFDSEAWVNNGNDEEAGQESRVIYDHRLSKVRVVPIRGRIYFVEGLNITAKLKEIRPLTKVAGVLEMSHHGSVFYINPSDLRKASPRQVEHYLEESDYNNAP